MAKTATKPQATPVAAVAAKTATKPQATPVAAVAAPQATAPAAPVASVATTTEAGARKAAFIKSGESIARSTAQRARLIAELGEMLKECTTFDAWECARVDFIAGARLAGFAAPDALWGEIIRAGQSMSLIGDKPKSAGPEAVKKQGQRATKADKVAEAIKAGTKPLELVAQSRELLDAGKVSEAASALDLAKALQEKVQKDATKAASEACAKLAEKARECIKAAIKAGDEDALRRMVNAYAKPAPKASKTKASKTK